MELAKELMKRKVKRMWRIKVAAAVLSLVILILSLAAVYFYNRETAPVSNNSSQVEVTIPEGASTKTIGEILSDKGIIKSGLVFRIYARWHNYDGRLKAGQYRLAANLSTGEIMARLRQGPNVYYSFTVPEGYTTRQIADMLAARGLVNRDKFMDLVAHGNFNYSFLEGAPAGERRLEGFLFPDTYKIEPHVKEEDIIKMMLDRFQKELTPEFQAKARSMNMSVRQVVILASMIEREARVPGDRAKVSAVFHNRLNLNRKLESCATVQYVLGDPNKKVLSLKDIAIESPYNTYKYAGLPAGPIASPGKAALDAALNPAPVKYLYFVATPDGSNAFSNTEAEHNAAKKKYLGK